MTRPWCPIALAAALWLVAAACDGDGAIQGHRGPCATPTGAFVGCETEPLETAEDACWRLVDCGVIPLERNEENQGTFDWRDCVFTIEELPSQRENFVIQCIGVSSCDDLQLPNSPRTPREDELLCLAFGDLQQAP